MWLSGLPYPNSCMQISLFNLTGKVSGSLSTIFKYNQEFVQNPENPFRTLLSLFEIPNRKGSNMRLLNVQSMKDYITCSILAHLFTYMLKGCF